MSSERGRGGSPERPERGGGRRRGEERQRARREREAPIWAAPQRERRRPSVSREDIAATALAIADAEGVDAVSMRRVATELGVGTMTLYHYVRSKTDLYALVGDALMGELLLDDAELDPVDWRGSIARIARSSRDVFRRHPWMILALDRGGEEIGPNGLRHFEQSLAAVEGSGLDPAGRLQLVALVDDYVFGHALRAVEEEREQQSEEWRASVEAYVESQLASGEFPQIEALLGDGDRNVAWARLIAAANLDTRFEVGLQALLEGIAAQIERDRGA